MSVWFDIIQLTLALSIGWLGWALLSLTRAGVATGLDLASPGRAWWLRVAKRQAVDSEG